MTLIDGEYYTVNPQAIRTMLDVYGENVRKVVPVQSEEFGLVMTIWVGAMSEWRSSSDLPSFFTVVWVRVWRVHADGVRA
jgi:phosphatidylserine decarboxylase